MKKIIHAGKFDRDLKRMVRRGADIEKLFEVVARLTNGQALDPRHEDHPLHGKLVDKRDCHISPDWVLIYSVDKDVVVLYRTGTHAELYG
ncbi:MAG: type II toxin-antitoxin system RelE/ParE family toxin [Anaerolineaceae bacterium]|nr:type II toxin-antitoxin system mRNA interferase toxin, RelE/StbE family [Anaerolineaceae bacterium]